MNTPASEPASAPNPETNPRLLPKLKELGEVMIPVSLVALVSQAFSLSARLTAILSLYTIVVLYTWLYRHWINSKVRSVAVLLFTLTVMLGAILFMPKGREADLSRSGITGYGERANDWAIPQVPALVAKAKHDVWYVGVDFHISSSQHQDLLLKQLAAGVNVRFLFYDFLSPDSQVSLNPNFSDVVSRFDYQAPQLLADLTSTVENLRRLQARWKNTPGGAQLEIRVYRAMPWTRTYLFDPVADQGAAFIVNYVYGKDTSNLPVLQVQYREGGILPTHYAGVQALWQTATKLDSWLPKYDAYKRSVSNAN